MKTQCTPLDPPCLKNIRPSFCLQVIQLLQDHAPAVAPDSDLSRQQPGAPSTHLSPEPDLPIREGGDSSYVWQAPEERRSQDQRKAAIRHHGTLVAETAHRARQTQCRITIPVKMKAVQVTGLFCHPGVMWPRRPWCFDTLGSRSTVKCSERSHPFRLSGARDKSARPMIRDPDLQS